MNKKINYLVILFLLLQPFLDLIAGSFLSGSIHLIIRGGFFVFCFFYLVRNVKDRKIILLYTVIMFLYFISYLFLFQYSLFDSLSFTLKLFYLPFLVLFFYHYEEKINERILCIVLLSYFLIFLSCYLFGVGNAVYEEGVKKVGFKGLFQSINEISAIFIILFTLVLNYFQKTKRYLLCIIVSILISIVSMLTGTKVILGGILITLLYFLYNPFTVFFKKQKRVRKVFIFFGMFLITIIASFIIIHTTAYKNAVVQANFFKIDHIFSLEGINKVIFNDRFSFIPLNHKNYLKSTFYEKLVGCRNNHYNKGVEIDLFDLFYKYGIIGFLLIIFILIYYGYRSRLKGTYLFSYILLFLISETSGHILIYPSVSLYFGIIIYFNNINQKKNEI